MLKKVDLPKSTVCEKLRYSRREIEKAYRELQEEKLLERKEMIALGGPWIGTPTRKATMMMKHIESFRYEDTTAPHELTKENIESITNKLKEVKKCEDMELKEVYFKELKNYIDSNSISNWYSHRELTEFIVDSLKKGDETFIDFNRYLLDMIGDLLSLSIRNNRIWFDEWKHNSTKILETLKNIVEDKKNNIDVRRDAFYIIKEKLLLW